MKGTNRVRTTVKVIIVGIMTALILSGCSSKKQQDAGSRPGQMQGKKVVATVGERHGAAGGRRGSIEIKPVDATRNSVLNLYGRGVSLAGAKVEWLVNGVEVPEEEGSSFKASGTTKGDEVQAKVSLKNREIESNVVEIKNAPPELKRVKIMPEVFKPGDRLRVEASAEDPDGDDVTIRYQWTKNGEPAGEGSEIDDQLSRGDKIEVRIAPYDGEIEGTPVVLKREINNMPPMIEEGGKFNFDGSVYTYQVKATDPDGDPLTYSLKDAPSGMTIDPETGKIRWNVPADFIGKGAFTAVVKDGHGGKSEYELTFNIDKQ